MPPGAVAPNRVMATTVEVEAVRILGMVRRRTPVEAVGTIVVKRSSVAIARSRQEDAITIFLTCYFVAVFAVNCSPFPFAVVNKFLKFLFCWHTPLAAPFGTGNVVCRVAGNVAQTFSISFTILFSQIRAFII